MHDCWIVCRRKISAKLVQIFSFWCFWQVNILLLQTISRDLKAIHFVNSVCAIFILCKKDPRHQTFQATQSWYRLSFYENKIFVQNCLLNEWTLIAAINLSLKIMMAVNVFSSSVFFRFITIFHQHHLMNRKKVGSKSFWIWNPLLNRMIITIMVHNPSFLLDIRIVVCCHAEKMPLKRSLIWLDNILLKYDFSVIFSDYFSW